MFGFLEPWVLMAGVNTFIALAIVFLFKTQLPSSTPSVKVRVAAWALPAIILLGTLTLIVTAPASTASTQYEWWEILGLVLWVPVIEEFVFRRALFVWLSQRFPKFWSLYLSALVFALAHSSPPTFIPPLGPFLLGLLAAWSYQSTQRLLAPILLHSVCNGSAILFACYAPGWLDRLSWLYQRL
ncbi:MAG: CPBP family intramembrane glutamic endopeptidase [Bdellovibrionota bacterium]|nr:MAG: CPBP family intramembrane metalloprotease [Pseudomonadota bacterium]